MNHITSEESIKKYSHFLWVNYEDASQYPFQSVVGNDFIDTNKFVGWDQTECNIKVREEKTKYSNHHQRPSQIDELIEFLL